MLSEGSLTQAEPYLRGLSIVKNKQIKLNRVVQ